MKVPAYHSSKPESEVFHDESGCTEGNNIENWNVRAGTGNKRQCKHCAQLAAQRRLFNGTGLGAGFFNNWFKKG